MKKKERARKSCLPIKCPEPVKKCDAADFPRRNRRFVTHLEHFNPARPRRAARIPRTRPGSFAYALPTQHILKPPSAAP